MQEFARVGLSFSEWGIRRKAWRPKTAKDYSQHISHAERWFFREGLFFSRASTEDLERYLLSSERSASSWNSARCALIAWFDYLEKPENPAKAIPRLRQKRGLPVPLEEPGQLLEAAWAYSPIFGALVTLYLHTGLRLSEVRTLRWDQIHKSWAFIEQKGGQLRSVYLPSAVMVALRRLEKTSVWCFPSPRNSGPLSLNWIWRKIRDLGLEAGMPGCRPHRLRHTFATNYYWLTGDLLKVQKALGQASIQSTEIYTRVQPVDLVESLEQLQFQAGRQDLRLAASEEVGA